MKSTKSNDAPQQTEPGTNAHCPQCGYDLSGLPGSRCPECGRLFDRLQLEQEHAVRIITVLPWDARGGVGGFLETLRWSLVAPRRIAEQFPVFHQRGKAAEFSLVCFASAWLMVVVTAALVEIRSLPYAVSIATGLAIGLWKAESWIAGFVAREVKTTAVFDVRHFWRGILHYLSGFLPLGVLPLAGGALVNAAQQTGNIRIGEALAFRVGQVSIGAGVAVFLWWLIALNIIIIARGSGAGRWTTWLIIPFLVFFGLLVGAAISGLAYLLFGIPLTLLAGA